MVHHIKKTMIFMLLLTSALARGQQYNNYSAYIRSNAVWIFQNNISLDFRSGVPKVGRSYIGEPRWGSVFGAASVADPLSGKLQFYTDGAQCWDSMHDVMANGKDLKGNLAGLTHQGVCIVPVIGQTGKYYVFSLLAGQSLMNVTAKKALSQGSLFYSVVDMSKNEGFGDVGMKNVVLDRDTLGAGMVAIPGNKGDVWLVVHKLHIPVFKAYHITEKGINVNPVLSTAGTGIQSLPGTSDDFSGAAYLSSALSVSPDRKMIVVSSVSGDPKAAGLNGAQLCRFDPTTGKVSGGLLMEKTRGMHCGAFSPDNTRFYGSCLDPDSDSAFYYQYTVGNYDQQAINNSIVKLGYTQSLNKQVTCCLRLYRDTLYSAAHYNFVLNTIDRPNLAGKDAAYRSSAITLTNLRASSCLSKEVVYPLAVMQRKHIHCSGNIEKGLQLRPMAIQEGAYYEWNDGSRAASLEVKSPGTYWVTYDYFEDQYIYTRTDTLVVYTSDRIPPVLQQKEDTLMLDDVYHTYQWLRNDTLITGADRHFHIPRTVGAYQVIVSDQRGCLDTSDAIEVDRVVSVSNRNEGSPDLSVFPNPSKGKVNIRSKARVTIAINSVDGRSIGVYRNVEQISISSLAEGLYMITVTDVNGRFVAVKKLIVFP